MSTLNKICGCKGIRSCALCNRSNGGINNIEIDVVDDVDATTEIETEKTELIQTNTNNSKLYNSNPCNSKKNSTSFEFAAYDDKSVDFSDINQAKAKSRGFIVEKTNLRMENNWVTNVNQVNYVYCPTCEKTFLSQSTEIKKSDDIIPLEKDLIVNIGYNCTHTSKELDFRGIQIFLDFVTPDEEEMLIHSIEETPYVNSQSGRLKQDFGPKVNFKRKKIKSGSFTGLPSYSRMLYERMRSLPGSLLNDFVPVEMCNLEYSDIRGAHIDPHIDDQWLWGERLVTLNLLSDSVLTFTHPDHPLLHVCVPLVRRSLLVVSQSARHEWLHAINPAHITAKRVAMTFRELSEEFQGKGPLASEGSALVDLALTFNGREIHL